MKSLILSFCLFLTGVIAHADVQFVPTEEILLKSDLIIQAKVRSVTQAYFRVEITKVFADQDQFGLNSGQYLKIDNIHWRGCMSPFDISRYDTVALALTKVPNGWRITNSEYIPAFKNGRAELVQDCPHTDYVTSEWKLEISELVRFFNYEDDIVCATTDLLSFNSKTKSRWVKLLYQCYYEGYWKEWNADFDCGAEIVHVEEPNERTINPDSIVYEFCALSPEPLVGLYDTLKLIGYRTYLHEKELLDANGMDGKFYISLIAEQDSSVSNVKVIRSLYNPLDGFVEQQIAQSVRLIPGGLSEPRKRRCRYTLPIRIIREL